MTIILEDLQLKENRKLSSSEPTETVTIASTANLLAWQEKLKTLSLYYVMIDDTAKMKEHQKIDEQLTRAFGLFTINQKMVIYEAVKKRFSLTDKHLVGNHKFLKAIVEFSTQCQIRTV